MEISTRFRNMLYIGLSQKIKNIYSGGRRKKQGLLEISKPTLL
jgi:hypothetical protein